MSLVVSSPPDEMVADPMYARLKSYVIESTGLAYYGDKDADLTRRIRRRLAQFGTPNCAAYIDILKDPARGPAELEALINEIAIGETYFFRHAEHFDALLKLVLPDLIARHSAQRKLSIWCAGCADGSEPYSLSILLRRNLAPQLAGWDVRILGTDINRVSLAEAREGCYDEWSFRSTPDELRQSCFVQERGRWRIAPAYREGVSFEFHNLSDGGLLSTRLSGFQLILCRNVMIYFAPDQMSRIVDRFHDGLTDGGWLLVGPSEPNMTSFRSFQAVNAPGVTLYQKAVAPLPEPAFPLPELSGTPPPAPAAPVSNGDLRETDRVGERLPGVESLNPLVHLQRAVALEQVGSLEEAERSLRRTIYLDRQSALAHYRLGLLLRARGEPRQAARSFDNILALLASRPDWECIAGPDALTVAELRGLAENELESLGAQP